MSGQLIKLFNILLIKETSMNFLPEYRVCKPNFNASPSVVRTMCRKY
jgi:hypothetical protein